MTPSELAAKCVRALDAEVGAGKVALVIPGPPPRGERVRLDRKSRRKCPMGEVMNWTGDPPQTVAMFDAIDVLAWLAANGEIRIEHGAAAEPEVKQCKCVGICTCGAWSHP